MLIKIRVSTASALKTEEFWGAARSVATALIALRAARNTTAILSFGTAVTTTH
jgi:hypothetical protein